MLRACDSRAGHGGPCPPIGPHRCFHKLYSLDSVLPDLGTPTKSALEAASNGHVIAQAELVSTYQRLAAHRVKAADTPWLASGPPIG